MKTSLVGAFVLGLAVAGIGYSALNPKSFSAPSAAVQTPHSEGDGHGHEAGEGKGDAHGAGHEGDEGGIHLTHEQIARSGIAVFQAKPGAVSNECTAHATVVRHRDARATPTTAPQAN